MKQQNWRKIRGFTLIELLIVLAIVTILAAMAYPSYRTYVIQSYVSEALQEAQVMRKTIMRLYADTGSIPCCGAGNGGNRGPSSFYNPTPYVAELKWYNNNNIAHPPRIEIWFNSKAPELSGAVYMLYVDLSTSSKVITWKCGHYKNNVIDAKYLPASCK